MTHGDTRVEGGGKGTGEDAVCEQQGLCVCVCVGLSEPHVNSAFAETEQGRGSGAEKAQRPAGSFYHDSRFQCVHVRARLCAFLVRALTLQPRRCVATAVLSREPLARLKGWYLLCACL